MNYDPQPIRDFALRTRQNLVYIEREQHNGANVYEVTQLVNSLLGLLIFPQQEYYNQIPEVTLADLKKRGWPEVKVTPQIQNSMHYQPCTTLRELLRYLRNAISHFNIRFVSDGSGQISGLRVWNHKDGDKEKPKNWEAELDLATLRQLTFCFIELLEKEKVFDRPQWT